MEELIENTADIPNALAAGISVRDLLVQTDRRATRKVLLSGVSLDIPRGHFATIIGPSGCGKSTLIRSLGGIQPISKGTIHLAGYPVDSLRQEYPLAIGYLAQFGAFHPELTVRENLANAVALRLPKSVPSHVKSEWVEHITQLAGIQHVLTQPYNTLSGGQMRRVALAEELIGDPSFLLLDELTSGLDEYSDQEMMLWLRDLAHSYGKTILLVTHATYHLHLADSVIFLHSGRLIQHGSLEEILHTHGVSSTAGLLGLYSGESAPKAPYPEYLGPPPSQQMPLKTAKPPSGWRQFPCLVVRQFQLFKRDSGQWWMHLALVVTFPAIVAVFATRGLPQVRSLTLSLDTNILQTMQEQMLYLKESFKAASLISGLAMFQVVLLTLMGANNSAREIAKERDILNKELRAGLSPTAYVASKFLQVLFLCALQAGWMTWFVKTLCGFPGSALAQYGILFATTLAMSTTCLAISAGTRSPERASLLSIYLVGFQMPLSGAALALPDWLNGICRPFIAAYWGWSGYLKTFDATRHYDIVKQSTKTFIASYDVSITVLGLHVLLSLAAAIYFSRKKQISNI
jgi:ABC-type multidrug transport system ATPase subunit